ncbi:MAG: response regulator [Desulfobacterota bacterium]|jgi:DNA-binding NtrC family response regulator|nr:response regulator [Thermodesulfobacteriota bacterium]
MKECQVLVVDDEADFRETIVKRLQKRQLHVSGAESGEKALELMAAQPFDVVVLDVKMPGLDGIETLREIKKKNPLVEVILLTGHASMESGIEGMKLGAFDFVMKPAALDELMEKIRQAYEKKIVEEARQPGA